MAQPPLYRIKRKKREEYVQDDAQLSKILIQLGTEDVRLRDLHTKKDISGKPLIEITEILEQLDKYARAIRSHGGDMEAYLAARDKTTGALPTHLVRIRQGNNETVHYFLTDSDLAAFAAQNEDLGLYSHDTNGDTEDTHDTTEKNTSTKKTGPARRARHIALTEAKGIAAVIAKLHQKGFDLDHYCAQDRPLYELIEGTAENEKRTPLFSTPEILEHIKDIGKRGVTIVRFKGLGEMNAKELFETTMNPANRKLLRIELTDAIEAEEMFTTLMGDQVEPRRQFIEDHALNVRNLDV